jgi:NAD+ synthase
MVSMVARRDWAQVAERIEGFIRDTTGCLRRDGALVGLSGGLDSTTTACLCVRALGRDRVLALVMPEKEGHPDVVKEACRAADFLGVRREVVDITPQLQALGGYDFVLSRIPTRALKAATVRVANRVLAAKRGQAPLASSIAGRPDKLVAAGSAHFKAKHRVRMVTACYRAERENLLLVGAANRTERLTGIFCKFGIDHCADAMPIAPLFRTEVLQLAAHLGVPEEILNKPPDPGVIPGVKDKYRFFLGMPCDVVDAVLVRLAEGIGPGSIAEDLGLPPARVREVRELVDASWHMRSPALEPEL